MDRQSALKQQIPIKLRRRMKGVGFPGLLDITIHRDKRVP